MGFAVLLYATYSQWSYVSAPQITYVEPGPREQNVETTAQSRNDVLSLSDTLPSIESRSISQETSSPIVRTDKLENNVIKHTLCPTPDAFELGFGFPATCVE